jgi:hypothetical protein
MNEYPFERALVLPYCSFALISTSTRAASHLASIYPFTLRLRIYG